MVPPPGTDPYARRPSGHWDVTDPHHPGHVGAVNAVLVPPRCRRGIVTVGADHTAQIWQTDTRHAIRRACETARPLITRQASTLTPAVACSCS
ncbi:hypothetical protein FGW37_00725 [Streptomyces rectiverticillatus]|uniref:hypothetical protein n=1 Tax=Streptomyces rectiverticillatus TaxID=173860 RepID=UPI0015C2F438|nr:hypothetical protein [Streptomyces rectiverticillatus]QLE70325.1 hypothetical protein FGW37_00725 [Streptomyces rectiverticillatus]